MSRSEQPILGIAGSIRPDASSALLLRWIGSHLPEQNTLSVFSELASIPPFDGAEKLPPSVTRFIESISSSKLAIFCSPEYAHGVPGVLKNALDWTVASTVWTGKRVVVITASSQGEHAHASLIEILKTMSAEVTMPGCLLISFIRSKINLNGELTDPATEAALVNAIKAFDL